jgi:hypothetical protein
MPEALPDPMLGAIIRKDPTDAKSMPEALPDPMLGAIIR